MNALLNILQTLASDIRRTIDEGAVTLARVDSHIALSERMLRGITVLLSTENAVPYMETALRSMQQVVNTLISIVTLSLIPEQVTIVLNTQTFQL